MPPGCITCTQATQGDAVRPADHPHSITPALLAPPPLHGYGMQVPYMPLGWLSGVPLDLVFYLLLSS